MIKIYPSSFALAVGATTNAAYTSGCPRYQVAGIREDFPPLYSAIGAIGEEYHIARLGTIEEREISIRKEVAPNVYVSGRYDGICSEFVYEFKTTLSRNLYTSIINKGEFLLTHLGQLVTYMVMLERSRGKLCVAYAHFNKAVTQLEFKPRDFIVELRDNDIYVDDVKTEYTVSQLMKFYSIVAQAHLSEALPPATMNDKACNGCSLINICGLGSARTKAEFLNQITELTLVKHEQYQPKIQVHDTKKKKSPKV